MSQTGQVATAAPPAAGTASTGTATNAGSGTGTVSPAPAPVGSDTPRRLRRLSTALIWVGVLFGLAGVVTTTLLAVTLDRADASTAQLVRVQQIQIDLLTADASATNAFLVGGLEPPAQRAAYDTAITEATSLITEAAREEPADSAALSALNTELVDYASTIEQARSANRQGYPVGAQYLRTASAGLRADALPILDNLVTANAARASGQMDVGEIAILAVAGVLALAALVLAQIWLARRFRRTFNVGLAVATGVALLSLVVGLVGLGLLGSSLGNLKAGAFADVNAGATARIEAYDAKSNESLTLVARGSGSAFEEAWRASADQVGQLLTGLRGDLATPWRAYADVHTEIRALDDGGRWDQAVRLATTADPGGANARFAGFDQQASAAVDAVAAETSSGLRGARVWLVLGAVLSAAAGIAVSLLSRRGVAVRLREYR